MAEIRIYYRSIEHHEMTIEVADDTIAEEIDDIVNTTALDLSGATSMQRSVDIEFWEIES